MELGMAHMYTTQDMGDTPAQLVLDKMARAKAQRREEEMKEELNKIKIRVENTIGSFEMQQKWLADQGFTNMEFFDDLTQLEAIISDSVQKKKYQHQVTVFIVGYEQASMERLQLLVQLNEFFVVNSATKEEDTFSMSPEIDLDDVAESVRSALDTAEKAVLRLGELNHDLVAFVGTHISAKDSKTKSKKKLEKALNQAKDDVLQLTEKLMNAQAEIKEKEEKITSMFKQMELKTIELQRHKSAADLAKKNAKKASETEAELSVKDGELRQLRSKVDELQVMLKQAEDAKENAQTKNRDFNKENEDLVNQLQSKLNFESYKMEDAVEELKAQYKDQITDLKSKHKDEVNQLKDSHMEELKNFLGNDADQYLGSTDGDIREWASSSEDERSFPTKARNKNLKQKKAAAQKRDELRKSSDSIDEWSEEGVGMVEPAVVHASLSRLQAQDGSGDESVSTPSRSEPQSGGRPQLGSRSMSNLTPVEEGQFEGKAALLEEENWDEVTDEELRHKFADYRQNVRQHIQDLEYQLKIVVTKSNKRVNLMKGQMQDQRNKFEGERQVFLDQVSQAQRLQEEAEKEADEAMMQLEEFINEQERIEMAQADVRAQREAQEQQVADAAAATVSQVDLQQLADVNTRRSSTASAKLESVFPPEGADTEDREATARASISSRTSQIRAQLEEKRAAIATRRSNAKVSAGSSFHSDFDVALGDYEGGDWADREISTQNTASSARATADHPAVKEYLKTYSSIVDFKNSLAKLMIDKEMMSASQLLNDITPVQFDSSQSVQQQLREMKVNIRIVLQEVGTIFQNCISSDLDYRVSSLMASREGPGSRPAPTPVRAPTGASPSEEEARRQLEEELDKLRFELDTRTKQHEDQLRRNTVAMMEMQDVIQQLQRDVNQGAGVKVDLTSPTVLGPQPSPVKYNVPETPTEQTHPQPVVESAIMFSRLDSERNAKSLKKAVNSGRLSPDVYEEVVGMMDQYVEIPGKRLRHLAEKYLHHSEMKAVEENVRRSSSLNGDVFKLLEKMETLQNKRAQKWSAQMDHMGDHRVRLANLLMDTLETIEQESGIFLIKPMFAYRGRARLRKYEGKISNNFRTPNYGRYTHFCDAPPIRLMKTPVPTPAAARHPSEANAAMYAAVHVGPSSGVVHTTHSRDKPSIPLIRKDEEDAEMIDLPVDGSEYVVVDPTETTWSPRNSQAHALAETNGGSPSGTHFMNTPRILELDVNRMLIGRNTISLRIPKASVGDDRMKNYAQTNVRSYMTLSRPSGTGSSVRKPKRPHSTTGADVRGFEPPPSTPMPRHPASAGARVASFQVSDLPASRPLPPIRLPTSEKKSRPSTSQTGHLTAESASPAPGPTSPPRSPPGSSMGPSPALQPPPSEEHPPPTEEHPPPPEEHPPETVETQGGSEVQYEDRATSVMTETSQQSESADT
ncbi:myosin heavy chain, non-muscle-like isoform X2 [Branchiostoma lanceolatum]|uniref:myosin heavy chain, non-muscle-like isoform X2 n=1 Tax=Branchiostoma lanceolatum TaxID=7740 RepID=UPI003452061F